MPELPEVETTRKDLSKEIIGLKIKKCWIGVPSRIFIRSQSLGNNFNEAIAGKTIKSVERKGKNIIINLSDSVSILIHQKISGHILLGNWKMSAGKWIAEEKQLLEKVNSFIHLAFFLSDGRMVTLSDPRKFFKVELWKNEDLQNSVDMKNLGPDALKISQKDFQKIILSRRQEIKKLLLNQNCISGIGNIYSDEILWDAETSPFRRANSLKEKEIEAIFKSMVKILKEALRLKGDSISDYRMINGERGNYQNFHKVYQRDGQPCKRQDGGIIQKKKFGSRYLRYCPVCQK